MSSYCVYCKKEFEEGEETVPLAEESMDSICLECADDEKNSCPSCGGHGCRYCL